MAGTVYSSSRLAVAMGMSPLVVGLTVDAYGTRAPELVVSVHSFLARQPDVAIGNVVGSNIFNILGVLGVSSVVSADGVRVSDAAFQMDIPVMIGPDDRCRGCLPSGLLCRPHHLSLERRDVRRLLLR